MATFSAIQTRVQRIVIDLPAAVTTEVPSLINEAIRNLMKEHNFKVMEALTSDNLTVISTRALMSVPSDLKEYRDDPYIRYNLGGYRPLTVAADRNSVMERYDFDDEGEPRVLLDAEPTSSLNARSWEVWPLPDGNSDWDDGEYRISVPYWKYLADLSGDSDQNWFTVNAEEYIIEDAAARAFALDWDMEQEAVHMQKAERFKQRIIKVDKTFRLMGVTTLVPHWRGENYPKLRR